MGMKPSYEKLIGQMLAASKLAVEVLGCRILCFSAERQGSFFAGRVLSR